MTEEENDKRLKDYLRLINEYFEKNKKPTLLEMLTKKQGFSVDVAYEIIDTVKEFLPKEHDTNSYDWNRCIKTIRGNLE